MAVALISDALRKRERDLAAAAPTPPAPDEDMVQLQRQVGDLTRQMSQLAANVGELGERIDRRDDLVENYEQRLEQMQRQGKDELIQAQAATNREFELRVIAENKPREVQIIREPAEPPPQLAPAPALQAVPPDPPRKWNMHVMARDPNGAIAHLRWTPEE